MKKVKGLLVLTLALGLVLVGCDSKKEETTASKAESVVESQAVETKVSEETNAKVESEEETMAQTIESESYEEVQDVKLNLSTLAEKSLGDFEDSDEIVINPEGASVVLWTDGTIKQLSVIGVTYNGDHFVENNVYYSKDEFTANNGLLITAYVPGDAPSLKVSYQDDQGQMKSYLLALDIESEKVILIDEESSLFGEIQ